MPLDPSEPVYTTARSGHRRGARLTLALLRAFFGSAPTSRQYFRYAARPTQADWQTPRGWAGPVSYLYSATFKRTVPISLRLLCGQHPSFPDR